MPTLTAVSPPASLGHFEEVVRLQDVESGLDAVVAIHSTALGPALGGLRLRPYPTPDDAVGDALRLARGMTYKAAAAGLDLGGGKAVVNADPATIDRTAVLEAFAQGVEALGGRYITAEDVGTTTADMAVVARHTSHVVGLSVGDGGLGDPSPSTALGVLVSMRAALAHLDGDGDVGGRTVAVLGLGKVGWTLASLLAERGAVVAAADVDEDRVRRAAVDLGVKPVEPDALLGLDCDVLAPCALGGVLTPEVARGLRCRVVAGAANNQLADRSVADDLTRRGVVYVPDFVANAGGLIHVAHERSGRRSPADDVRRLGARVGALLRRAQEDGMSPLQAAEADAEERLTAATRSTDPAGSLGPA
jgi:leucine dehydrogenase